MGHLVFPPKHNQFSDIIYNNFPTVTTLENNPSDIGTGSAVIETISFGYNNVRGVRLHAQFRTKYDLSKYVSSGQIRETISTSISFSPYNVDWWTDEEVWRKEPGVSGSIDITPYYKQYTGNMYVTGANEFDVPVGADGKLNMEAYVYKMKAFVPEPPNTISNYITVRVVGLFM